METKNKTGIEGKHGRFRFNHKCIIITVDKRGQGCGNFIREDLRTADRMRKADMSCEKDIYKKAEIKVGRFTDEIIFASECPDVDVQPCSDLFDFGCDEKS